MQSSDFTTQNSDFTTRIQTSLREFRLHDANSDFVRKSNKLSRYSPAETVSDFIVEKPARLYQISCPAPIEPQIFLFCSVSSSVYTDISVVIWVYGIFRALSYVV
ncbi:hypothetical protein F511_13021 [Dorcoceras hygrometricum]|uniref:Uncharacterized protein n=1 Tax=Dorcoceras hygrometricum TaxID=472368 RepID=A0A2Z7AMB5_9LAMI|nr:hypothetical protein F511_13021 [Dorcoceras hygrometricum]